MVFSEPKFIANKQNQRLFLVDSDQDDNLDILSGFNSMSLFKNLGDGDSFEKVHTFGNHGYGTNRDDLDGNGIVDVVYNRIVGGTGNIVNRVSEIHRSLGDIVFSPNPLPAIALSPTSFRITWNNEPTASKYYLQVSNNSNFSDLVSGIFNNINYESNKGYPFDPEDTSVVASVTNSAGTYYYRLRSEGSLGQLSPYSNYIEVDLPLQVPSTPVALEATDIGESSFRLRWEHSTDATYYEIDISLSEDFVDYVLGYNSYRVKHVTSDEGEISVDGNVQSIEVTGIVSDRYYYRVRSYNSDNDDDVSSPDYSSTIEVLLDPYAPQAYFVLPDNITETGFVGRWSDVDTTYTYEIQVSEVYNFSSTIVDYNNKDVMRDTFSSVTGLTSGESYYYRIRSRISDGSGFKYSSYSNIISVSTSIPANSTSPLTLAATDIKDVSFVANWSLSASYTDTEVKVEVAENIDFSSLSSSINVASSLTTTTITGLEAGTIYYYRVSDMDGSNNGNIITLRTLLPAPNAENPLAIRTNSFVAVWGWDASTEYSDATLYYELMVSKNI